MWKGFCPPYLCQVKNMCPSVSSELQALQKVVEWLIVMLLLLLDNMSLQIVLAIQTPFYFHSNLEST